MIHPGQIVLFSFPHADNVGAKLRPAMVLGKLPGRFDDWLICMISSRLHHYVDGFDEVIRTDARDYSKSGLKTQSVIRLGRLAVIDAGLLKGAIGEIDSERLGRIKANLANWLLGS